MVTDRNIFEAIERDSKLLKEAWLTRLATTCEDASEFAAKGFDAVCVVERIFQERFFNSAPDVWLWNGPSSAIRRLDDGVLLGDLLAKRAHLESSDALAQAGDKHLEKSPLQVEDAPNGFCFPLEGEPQ